jgi:hypothetical protein
MDHSLELVDYYGKWLTKAEIQLSKFFESNLEERANEARAKQAEREIMAQQSRSIQPVSLAFQNLVC